MGRVSPEFSLKVIRLKLVIKTATNPPTAGPSRTALTPILPALIFTNAYHVVQRGILLMLTMSIQPPCLLVLADHRVKRWQVLDIHIVKINMAYSTS